MALHNPGRGPDYATWPFGESGPPLERARGDPFQAGACQLPGLERAGVWIGEVDDLDAATEWAVKMRAVAARVVEIRPLVGILLT